jgi:hypothetical protein
MASTTEIGRITSVTQAQDERRIYVSVRISPEEYHEEIVFSSPTVGLWMMPSEGDIVEVYEISHETFAARTPHNPAMPTMPIMEEGDFALRLNQDTELFFSKQPDDTYNLSIETDGDISVTSDTDINLTVEKDRDLTGNVNVTVEGTGDIVAEAQQGNVTAKAPNGTATVDAPTVNVGDSTGTYKAVARKGDAIVGSSSDGASVTGTIDEGSGNVNST